MLELANVTKVYSNGEISVNALKEVSFRINSGEMVAIMGPSGSGKSTLMNLLGCLDRPTGGTYLLEGKDVSSAEDDELAEIRNKHIGFVFQQFNLLARYTVLDNVELPMVYTGRISRSKRRQLAKEMLIKVGLGDRLHHYPNQISGGQRQRVAIARALINSPSLILADEPTGALDTKTGEEIMSLFHELNDQGHTIVLVTHEHDIARHARRVIHLIDGEITRDEVVA